MATAYRGSQSNTGVASGNPPSAISGQANGDLIYGIWVGYPGAAFSAIATGWTTLDQSTDGNTGKDQYFAYRKADGSGSDSFNPTFTGSGDYYTFSFYNVDSTTPHEQFGLTQWAGTSATVYPPNATPSANDSAHVVVYIEGSGPLGVTTSPVTAHSYTQIFDNSTGLRTSVYYKLLSGQSGVAQGPINMVWSGSGYGPVWTAIANAGGGGGGGGGVSIAWLRA